jgi:hypothetical protein
MNSSDEKDEQMKPDELTGMYTPEMDPKAGPRKLTPAEVAYQRAVLKARKEQMILSAPGVDSPQPDEIPEVVDTHVNMLLSGGSSDDDDLCRPEHIWSSTLGQMRRNKAWTRKLADAGLALPAPDPACVQKLTDPLALPAPEPQRQPTPVSSDTEDHLEMTEDQKRLVCLGKKKAAAASQRAPADQPKGAKALPPTKEQQAPKHPMATRTREASRAGSLRSGGGSWQTDTCVAQGNPSKT